MTDNITVSGLKRGRRPTLTDAERAERKRQHREEMAKRMKEKRAMQREQGIHTLNVSLHADHIQWLGQLANEYGKNLSDMMDMVLRDYKKLYFCNEMNRQMIEDLEGVPMEEPYYVTDLEVNLKGK